MMRRGDEEEEVEKREEGVATNVLQNKVYIRWKTP